MTLSATDQVSPTMKQVIATLEQFLGQLKLTDSGLTGIQGKMRTAFSAAGATNLFPTQQITAFSAGLNQAGLNLDTTAQKVTASTSKFAAFGSALMANGTAFGVAGASAFGLFNAIDNLEKVQLRASTATLRSSTATTALTTAELALANAKATGTASTEQIALLEQRVSDARERVAVTTERATIFQQDYTEALAGLALQVGPQAIALGGSLAQVYTVLNATFAKGGGFINTLKTAFGSLSATQVSSNAASAASIPILRSMAAAETTATVATRGLSTAIKGLLAATGVGIAVVIGTSLFEAFSAGADEAAKNAEALTPALDSAGQSMDEFGNIAETAIKDLPAGFKELQTILSDVSKATEEQSKKVSQNLATIINGTLVTLTEGAAKSAETGKQQIENLSAAGLNAIAKLEQRRTFLQQAIKSQAASGVTSPELQTELDTIQPKIDAINASLKTNEATLKTLAPITDKYASGVGDLGKNMDISTAKAELWLQSQVDAKIASIQDLASLRELAKAHGVEIPASLELSVGAYEKYIAQKLNLIPADKAEADANALSADSLEIKANAMRLVTAGYIGQAAATTASVGELEAFNAVIVPGIVALQQKAQALKQVDTANQVANATTFEAIKAAGDEVIAMTDLGAIYDGSATSFLALTTAKVAGVQAAAAFVTQAELEATTLEANTAALQEFITVNEGITIPPWITVTPELLKKIQTEVAATGGAFGTLATAMNEAMAPALESIDKLINAESMKEFKKAFKDLPGIEDFSKNTRGALMDIEKDMRTAQTRFKEFGTDWNQLVIGITRGASGKALADLGENLKKDFESFSKIDVTGLTKVFDPVMEFIDGLTGTQLRTQGPKLAGIVNDIMKAFESGQTIDWNEMNALIIANADAFALFPDIFSKIVAEGNPSAAAIDAVNKAAAKLFALQPPAWINDPQKNFLGLTAEQLAGTQGKTPEDEKGTPVPGPVKANDFDTKKAAIIKEITDIGTTTVVVPTKIPPPDSAEFATAMNDLLLIPADFTTRFNTAFVGLVIPAPDQTQFANAMNVLLLIPADFTTKFNTAFTNLTVPAPITAPFVTGIGKISTTVAAVITDISVLQTAVTIPAPDTSAFTEAFTTISTDATESLQEIIDFVADDLTTSFDGIQETLSGDVTDTFSQFATDSTDSLQEIVDFLADDLTTAFEDLQSTGESVAAAVASAMDDIGAAAASAEGEVQSLIDTLNSIPTDITVTIHIKVVGDPSGGVKAGAEGYHGIVDEPTIFLAGEKGEERIDIKPLTGPDTAGFTDDRSLQMIPDPGKLPSTSLTPYTYSQPPAITGPIGPMVANITIPVYVNGQYQGTTQTTKILRDMGAYLG